MSRVVVTWTSSGAGGSANSSRGGASTFVLYSTTVAGLFVEQAAQIIRHRTVKVVFNGRTLVLQFGSLMRPDGFSFPQSLVFGVEGFDGLTVELAQVGQAVDGFVLTLDDPVSRFDPLLETRVFRVSHLHVRAEVLHVVN